MRAIGCAFRTRKNRAAPACPAANLLTGFVAHLLLLNLHGRPAAFRFFPSRRTMLQQKTLDLKGSFANYPFAEVTAEIAQAGLSGSLRASWGDKKSIIYFEDGAVVHAVSNARSLRLFCLLVEKKKLEQQDLSAHPDFVDDNKLSASLLEKGVFTRDVLDALTIEQAEAVIVDVLSWTEGNWLFSPHARVRADMHRRINATQIAIDYARCLSAGFVSQRFKSVKEVFELSPVTREFPALRPDEGFLLSRFDGKPLSFEEVRLLAGIPDEAVARGLYVLWVGGLLKRTGWNAAFSPSRLNDLLNARLSLVQAQPPEPPKPRSVKPEPDIVGEEIEAAPAGPEISLEDYLDRVERAETLYDVVGVAANAKAAAIKQAYFALAKLFHPDRYHRESPDLLRRVQNAFTELAHAHETLKNQQSRDSYDLRIKKDQELKKRAGEAGAVSTDGSGVGFESFDQGMQALKEGDTETATKCFARAVHYVPNNALYHAFFGKALSADEKYKHRAESEFQTAVRLDPKDPKVRIMLVEFLIEMKLAKRAEGELTRFLEISPGHPQAVKMLADLHK